MFASSSSQDGAARRSHNGESTVQIPHEPLSGQLCAVQRILYEHQQRAYNLITFVTEVARHMEAEILDLRSENTGLRSQLSSAGLVSLSGMYAEAAGTGEPGQQSDVKLPRPMPPPIFADGDVTAPESSAPPMNLPGSLLEQDLTTIDGLDLLEQDTATLKQESAEDKHVHSADGRSRQVFGPTSFDGIVPQSQKRLQLTEADCFEESIHVLEASLMSASAQPFRNDASATLETTAWKQGDEETQMKNSNRFNSESKEILRDDLEAVESRTLPHNESYAAAANNPSVKEESMQRVNIHAPENEALDAATEVCPTTQLTIKARSDGQLSHAEENSATCVPTIEAHLTERMTLQGEAKFHVWPVWRAGAESMVVGKQNLKSKLKQKKIMNLGGGASFEDKREVAKRIEDSHDGDWEFQASVSLRYMQRTGFCSSFMMVPNTTSRASWDILSLFLVLYDLIAIPLQFFEPPEDSFSEFMEWFTRVFWSMDMPVSFFTGYVTTDGRVEMSPNMIWRRYLRTWFLLDALVVSTDWMEILLQSGPMGYASIGKASRTFRILRMIRLLRLARMREIITYLTERLNSEKLIILVDISKLTIVLLGFAHLIACVWYGIGAADSEKQTWVKSGWERESLGAKYAMSLHWSLAQFAGGMDEVVPKCLVERIFAVCIYVCCFIFATVFVSSLTSSMTQLNIIGSQQSQQLSVLRKYLMQNGITHKLAVRVKRNAAQAMVDRQKFMPETEVKLLHMVSEPLRVEIHLEMYSPYFGHHPFFREYLEECPMEMRKVCHTASCIQMVSQGDVIFSAGEAPSQPKMYIVCMGILQYHPADEQHDECDVGVGSWISEAVLWTKWTHRGMLVAKTDCRLFELDAKKFQDIAGQFEHNDFDPKDYANEFVLHLNNPGVILSDLPFEFKTGAASITGQPMMDTADVVGTAARWARKFGLRKTATKLHHRASQSAHKHNHTHIVQ